MLTPVTFQLPASVAATTAIVKFKPPRGGLIIATSFNAQAFGGTPTNANITINKNGSSTGITNTNTAAGTTTTWKSKHVGGSNNPVAFAADDVLSVDLAFTAGTSPTVSHASIVIWVLMGAV